MPLKYAEAPDVKQLVDELIDHLHLYHVVPQFVYCIRSEGSQSQYTVARIHGFSRIWQKALGKPPAYLVEVISERYDTLSVEEQEKTMIHELLHIPKTFSGGLRPHTGYITRKQVEQLHATLKKRRANHERLSTL